MICRVITLSACLVAGTVAVSTGRYLRQSTSSTPSPTVLEGNDLSKAYRDSIQAEAMRKHLEAFQFAADVSGGNRAAGTDGWLRSLEYVADQLAKAGYSVQYNEFSAPYYDDPLLPELVVVSSAIEINNTAPANEESTFYIQKGSGSGMVEAQVTIVSAGEFNAFSGCDLEHFRDFPPGDIALIQQGECRTSAKIQNAVDANASGVILVNEGTEGKETASSGRFKLNYPIPVLSGSSALGESFVNAMYEGDVVVRMMVNTIGGDVINKNIIVESTHGDPTQTILVGSHLDSVLEGPGVEDNGSGCSGVLELALQLKMKGFDNAKTLKNRIRFAWWGAEEIGLLGSTAYVASLTEEEISNLAMYINMDMIGSPNFVRFILDGDGSNSDPELEPVLKPGTPMAHIEQTLHNYFEEVGLPIEEEPFSNSYMSTDHTPFYDAGIPVTDIHSGIGGIPKSEEQAAIFGGEAGAEWDPCYHEACDTIENVDTTLMEEMTRAAAHAVAMYGSHAGKLFGFSDTGIAWVDRREDVP